MAASSTPISTPPAAYPQASSRKPTNNAIEAAPAARGGVESEPRANSTAAKMKGAERPARSVPRRCSRPCRVKSRRPLSRRPTIERAQRPRAPHRPSDVTSWRSRPQARQSEHVVMITGGLWDSAEHASDSGAAVLPAWPGPWGAISSPAIEETGADGVIPGSEIAVIGCPCCPDEATMTQSHKGPRWPW
jgi:hypothetical protein